MIVNVYPSLITSYSRVHLVLQALLGNLAHLVPTAALGVCSLDLQVPLARMAEMGKLDIL